MSVRVGTRLEQLEALRTKIDQEIAAERRRLALDATQRRPTWKPSSEKPRRAANPAGDKCTEIGVTPRQVKEWAVRVGIIPAVVRGRLAEWIVDAYIEAHP